MSEMVIRTVGFGHNISCLKILVYIFRLRSPEFGGILIGSHDCIFSRDLAHGE